MRSRLLFPWKSFSLSGLRSPKGSRSDSFVGDETHIHLRLITFICTSLKIWVYGCLEVLCVPSRRVRDRTTPTHVCLHGLKSCPLFSPSQVRLRTVTMSSPLTPGLVPSLNRSQYEPYPNPQPSGLKVYKVEPIHCTPSREEPGLTGEDISDPYTYLPSPNRFTRDSREKPDLQSLRGTRLHFHSLFFII